MKWLLVLLGVAACPGGSVPFPPVVDCDVTEDPVEVLAEVGAPVEVRLGVTQFCGGDGGLVRAWFPTAADAAKVEVLDPDGEPIAFTATAPALAGTSNAVRVTFTPRREGEHRLTVRFEPAIGNTTHTIDAVPFSAGVSRRTIASKEMSRCSQCLQTALGTVVCGGCVDRAVVTQTGQRIDADDVLVDGTTLWITRRIPLRVQRWVERDGGAFFKTHEAAYPEVVSTLMAPAPNGIWLFLQTSLQVESARVVRAGPLDDGGLGGPSQAIADRFFPSAMVSGDGNAYLIGRDSFLTLDGVGATFHALPARDRVPFISGDSMLWSTDFFTKDIEVLKLSPTGFERAQKSRPALFGGNTRLVPGLPILPPGRAFFGSTIEVAAVADFVDGGIVLTGYRSGDGGFSIVGATKQHVFLRSNDGSQLQVIDR